MIQTEKINELKIKFKECLSYDTTKLLENPEWGKINFLSIKNCIEQIKNITAHFETLPIELLPNNDIAIKIIGTLTNINKLFSEIMSFSIEVSNPVNAQKNIMDKANSLYNELFVNTFQFIPYLAYQRGDVERNISIMVKSVQDTNDKTAVILEDAKQKEIEIQNLVEASRQAAISAGVGSFTKDFLDESNTYIKSAEKWLIATIIFAGVTLITSIGFAIISLFNIFDSANITQLITSKITIILILVTATLWTAKLYKTSVHLSVVNKHKANALQTFLAFSQASNDEQTKNAVLIEATHCIFSPVNTGLANAENGSESVKYLEVFKNISNKN